MEEASRPATEETAATVAATASIPPMEVAQNRAAAAGRIMIPTAINVPSA